MRERQDDHARSGPRILEPLLEHIEKVLAGAEGQLVYLCAGEQRPVLVDRIRRHGYQRGVARLEQGPHEVGQPLFGADRVDDLGVRVERDPEFAGIEIGDGLTQLGDTAAGGVAVVARIVGGFA